jgi:UDP-2,3-diacylglucosamine pyrophosphatase LpxH
MTNRLFAVSDLHISPPGPLNGFHQAAALASFVRAHAAPGTTLALVGDVFDLLQVDARPDTLDMVHAADLLRRTLAAIAAGPGGADLFAAFRAFLESSADLLVLPGNHDPELHDPAARAVLLDAFGLPTDHRGLTVHTGAAPCTVRAAGHDVLLAHGHRGDPWNDIDPDAVHRAVATGDAALALPPGSRLVLQAMNRFKLARDARTGAPRFPFVDLLKPQEPAVPLLLLYLDLPLALAALGDALGPLAHRLLRGARRSLWGGPTLGEVPPDQAADACEILGETLATGFDEAQRRSPARCLRAVEDLLDGVAPAAGTVAAHGDYRFLLRAFLRRASREGTFFDPAATDAFDRAILAEHIPAGAASPRVVIAGHTHAAREIRTGGGVYLNTGTWNDLMVLPRLDDRAAVERFADQLETGDVPRLRRPTYAEVTAEVARLREWTEEGPAALRPISG